MALACVPVVVGHIERADAEFRRRVPWQKKPSRVDFPQLAGFCTIRACLLVRLQKRRNNFNEI